MGAFANFLALTESYVNLLPRDADQREQYKQQVYDLLVAAYASQGGLAGSGFRSPDDMVRNIPFWKLDRKDGKVRAVAMYKDSGGRKRVAVATDGTPEGKRAASRMMIEDLTQGRSYGEASGKSLSFALKNVDLKPYLIPFEKAKAIMQSRGDVVERPADDDPEVIRHPDLKNFFYSRIIGGEPHTKIMVGAPGKSYY